MTIPRRPLEGALVSTFGYVVLAEQDQLGSIPEDVAEQLHLYMVCTRPRIAIVPDEFEASDDLCRCVFTAQHADDRQRIEVEVPNVFGDAKVKLVSPWPHGDFEIVAESGERLSWGRSSLLLTILGYHDENLDLDVLYIGQAYGAAGARSARERLAAHETLQGIYGEAVRRSPDKDVFLVLLSLDEPYGLMMFSPVAGDQQEIRETFQRLRSPVSEQQRLNFTEAALIRYFAPPYNKEYKRTFPSPAHKTYAECYDLDLNAVAFEMETSEVLRTRLYSETVDRAWWHTAEFPLHDPAVRRSMFDFSEGV